MLVQSQEGDVSNFDHLETDTRNITDGMAFTTETGYEDFVIFINETEATVIRDESGDFLSILKKLDTNTLPNSGVRLLGFNANLG